MLPHKLYNNISSLALWKILLVFLLYVLVASILFASVPGWSSIEILYLLFFFSIFTVVSHLINLLLFTRKVLLNDALRFSIIMHIYICIYALFLIALDFFYPKLFQPVYHFISEGAGLVLVTFPVYISVIMIVFFKGKYSISSWKAGGAIMVLLYGIYALFG